MLKRDYKQFVEAMKRFTTKEVSWITAWQVIGPPCDMLHESIASPPPLPLPVGQEEYGPNTWFVGSFVSLGADQHRRHG